MLPNLVYIIKLLNYSKLQCRWKQAYWCMHIFCCMYFYMPYVLTNWYFDSSLASSLTYLFFVMPVTIVSTITFNLNMVFLNFGIQSFSKDFQLPSWFKLFLKADIFLQESFFTFECFYSDGKYATFSRFLQYIIYFFPIAIYF